MVGRYTAGATNLPFFPLRSYFETDLPTANPLHPADRVAVRRRRRSTPCPPLRPDVTIVHAQRADAGGDTQVWGLLGCQKEAAFAAERVIVVVEELVDEAVIRADPNRTIIPGLIVDAVVVEPWGAHPVVRPGRLRPRQPLLPATGTPITPRPGGDRRPGSTSGSTASTAGPTTSRSSAAERMRLRLRPIGAGAVRLGRLRASTDERGAAEPEAPASAASPR